MEMFYGWESIQTKVSKILKGQKDQSSEQHRAYTYSHLASVDGVFIFDMSNISEEIGY